MAAATCLAPAMELSGSLRNAGTTSTSGRSTDLAANTNIATLVGNLRKCSLACAEAAWVNTHILPWLLQRGVDAELHSLLARFGFSGPQLGFTEPVIDLLALTTALHKYLYVKMGQIGAGAYGAVFKAYHRETHELLAIKAADMTEYGLAASTLREITMLKELRHPNIVGLRDVIMSPVGPPSLRQGTAGSGTGRKQSCYLVVELLHCDLHAFMQHRPHALSMSTAKSIMYQLLSGLKHAHMNGIMHRDIKPQNILMGPAPSDVASAAAAATTAPEDTAPATAAGRVQIKIADFGLARSYLPDEQAYTDWVVTLFYRPPELLLGCKSYSPNVDVWSAGCVLAEMANTGSPLFVSDSELGQLDDIFAKLGTPSAKAWPELEQMLGATGMGSRAYQPQPLNQLVPRLAADPQALDLLSRMLAPNPRHRVSAARALAHPWFDDIRAAEAAALQAGVAAEAARQARAGAVATAPLPHRGC